MSISTFSPVTSDFNNPSAADHNIEAYFPSCGTFNVFPLNSDDHGPFPELVYAAVFITYSVLAFKFWIV